MSIYVKFNKETILYTSLGVPIKFNKNNEYKVIKQDQDSYYISNIKLKFSKAFCLGPNEITEGLCKIGKDSFIIEVFNNHKVMNPVKRNIVTEQEKRLLILKEYLK